MLITFGAAVISKPSPTQGRIDKPPPSALHGIFLGYRFAYGGTWGGEYLVESLGYVADVDFSYSAVGHSKVLSPHVTKQVRLPSGGDVAFPLKAQFDQVNFALAGFRGEFAGAFMAPRGDLWR